LPDGFTDRLAQSVKGSRIAWRIKAVICIVVVIGIGVSIMEFSRGVKSAGAAEPALIAADAPAGTTEVSGWFLLGYLRECFKRNRTSKKKEEE
jgi:hypothetical protein